MVCPVYAGPAGRRTEAVVKGADRLWRGKIVEEQRAWNDVMVARKITRRVRVLDTSNHISLFAYLERAAGVTAAAAAVRSAPRVKFESPDPRSIFINQVRLDEHLQAVGL